MSGPANYLLVDIGNTCIKYAKYCPEQGVLDVQSTEDIDHIAPLVEEVEKVLLACVAKDERIEQWKDLCQSHNIPHFIAQTQSETFGVKCAYQNYHTLGVDRWLAILAARHLTDKPVAVIDLGTAITCDIVIGNQHCGGWITPGFDLMRASLTENTARVFADQSRPNALEFGQSTEECVKFGCLAAVQGVLKVARDRLQSHHEEVEIFVTGGGQQMLLELLEPGIQCHSNLVLVGLSLFIDQSH